MARRSTGRQGSGLSPFAAGLVAIAVVAVGSWFGFSQSNPFSDPFTLTAAFEDTGNVQPGAPVRIAGVDVGKVTKVEPLEGGEGGLVEMEISDEGLPIHRDATLKVRSRIFLEGNTFIDLRPGSPSAPELKDDDDPIPATQTAAPVHLGEVLTTLQSDTREDLKTFLDEYSKALDGKGAAGFRESAKYWEEAYRNGAISSEATLGEDPDHDIARVLRGGQRTAAALARNEQALKGLVTNLATTAAAFARESAALEASVPALRELLDVAYPALHSINDALPSARAFAQAALPGVRSSEPVLRDGTPFLRQAAALFGRDELGGTARQLRRWMPSLVDLNETTVGALEQARALSACTGKVLVPFAESPIPNPDEPGNTNQEVYKQIQRGFVGLAGESRLTDGNQSWFRTMAVAPGELLPGIGGVRPAPPSDRGHQPPPRRPDVPCETQEPPNLNAPGGPLTQFITASERKQLRSLPDAQEWNSAIQKLGTLLRSWNLSLLRKQRAAAKAEAAKAQATAEDEPAAGQARAGEQEDEQ